MISVLGMVLVVTGLAGAADPHSMASEPIGLTFWSNSGNATLAIPFDVRYRTWEASASTAYTPGKVFGLTIYIR